MRRAARVSRALQTVKDIKMIRFAVIGALGAVANVCLMTVLEMPGVDYLLAAVMAAEATIVSNFFCQEKWVFTATEPHRGSPATRFVQSLAFNNAETLLRLPTLWLLVDRLGVLSQVAQIQTLALAFIARYAFHSRRIYPQTDRPQKAVNPQTSLSADMEHPNGRVE